MRAHWNYLKYVLRHKWFVFVAGFRLGIPFTALMHDNSKFRPREWFAYVEFFYGKPAPDWANITAYEKTYYFDSAWKRSKEGRKEAFDVAWCHHQKHNKHHWQYWMLLKDDGSVKLLPMPDRYRREMLADWRGAGRAIKGYDDTVNWYQANAAKMQLHPDTRAWIERQLGVAA